MDSGRAYVLRCWSEGRSQDERTAWRFTVEEIGPERRRRGFGSFEALVQFLAEELPAEPTEARRQGGETQGRPM